MHGSYQHDQIDNRQVSFSSHLVDIHDIQSRLLCYLNSWACMLVSQADFDLFPFINWKDRSLHRVFLIR